MKQVLSSAREGWRAFLSKQKWARIGLKYRLHQRALSNRASRRGFRADEPRLDDLQRRLVGEMQQRGIAVVTFEELFGDTELWGVLEADIHAFAQEAEASIGNGHKGGPAKKQDYYFSRWAARHRRPEPRSLPVDDPWLSFSLSSRVLDVVNGYRGLRTSLLAFDNVYTVPFRDIEQRVGSQQWHRDPEDMHVVKVFVYFSDVDDDAGPFEYIAGSAKGGPYGDLWPWHIRGRNNYPPAGELEKLVPASERISVRGPAGTIIFCDTSGFHRGGFARSKPRILSNHTYVSPAAFVTGRAKYQVMLDRVPENGQLTDAARFAVTAARS